MIKNVKSKQALDVEGGSHENCAKILQWSEHGGDHQKYKLIAAGDGYFKVQAKHSGKYWDIEGGSTDQGAQLIVE